jgi:hypothetical protein
MIYFFILFCFSLFELEEKNNSEEELDKHTEKKLESERKQKLKEQIRKRNFLVNSNIAIKQIYNYCKVPNHSNTVAPFSSKTLFTA